MIYFARKRKQRWKIVINAKIYFHKSTYKYSAYLSNIFEGVEDLLGQITSGSIFKITIRFLFKIHCCAVALIWLFAAMMLVVLAPGYFFFARICYTFFTSLPVCAEVNVENFHAKKYSYCVHYLFGLLYLLIYLTILFSCRAFFLRNRYMCKHSDNMTGRI